MDFFSVKLQLHTKISIYAAALLLEFLFFLVSAFDITFSLKKFANLNYVSKIKCLIFCNYHCIAKFKFFAKVTMRSSRLKKY